MGKLSSLAPKRVFELFEEISSVPRGSGNMEAIGQFCLDFASENNLEAYKDEAGNVVVFKPASIGYENADTVMLQGHMDIVCQKEADIDFDFEKQGLDLIIDGDFVTANGTTLGADNGIAMAMAMAILEDTTLAHPAIEAVFTVDEEIGLVGASKIDCTNLKSKKMINIDSDESNRVIVSCAGGCDTVVEIPTKKETKNGTCVTLILKGLKGGHSGCEIDKERVNANILAGRILNHLSLTNDFEIISINGGDKGNAITNRCEICLLANESVIPAIKEYLEEIKTEISDREENFGWELNTSKGDFEVLTTPTTKEFIYILNQVPNGIIAMSTSIKGLVETSLNLGILETTQDLIKMQFMLRSNKRSPLVALAEKLENFFSNFDCKIETFGMYFPWEFKKNSALQEVCKDVYKDVLGFEPEITAIHAGLECGMFSDKMSDLDCIAIGPDIIGGHTTEERMKISSVKDIYECVLEILKRCK